MLVLVRSETEDSNDVLGMVDGASVRSVVVENLHGGGSAAVMVTVSYRKSYGKSVLYRQKSWCVRSVVAVTNFVGRNYDPQGGQWVYIKR